MAENLCVKMGGAQKKNERLIWSYIMTLNDGRGIWTTDTPDCIFSDVGTYASNNAYALIHRRGSSSCQTSSGHTFTFNFTTPINAVKVQWSNSGSSDSRKITTFRVQYSDDGTTWITALEKTNMTVADKAAEKVDDLNTDDKPHSYWRVYEHSSTDNHINMSWLDFVVKVED